MRYSFNHDMQIKHQFRCFYLNEFKTIFSKVLSQYFLPPTCFQFFYIIEIVPHYFLLYFAKTHINIKKNEYFSVYLNI